MSHYLINYKIIGFSSVFALIYINRYKAWSNQHWLWQSNWGFLLYWWWRRGFPVIRRIGLGWWLRCKCSLRCHLQLVRFGNSFSTHGHGHASCRRKRNAIDEDESKREWIGIHIGCLYYKKCVASCYIHRIKIINSTIIRMVAKF